MKQEYVVVQIDSNGCIIKSSHHWKTWNQIHDIFHHKGERVSVSIQEKENV